MKPAWIAKPNTIYLHFTNYMAGWGAARFSTGFVESIVKNGAKPFLNVGYSPMEDFGELRRLFVHHGKRCKGKKEVNGNVSLPAVIVIDGSGLPVQQGADHEFHIQVNVAIGPERILGWFPVPDDVSDEDFNTKVHLYLSRPP